MLKGVGPTRIEALHDLGAPAKRAKLMPPPRYFPNVVRSGRMPCASCNPPGASREVMDLVEDQQSPGFVRQGAQAREKFAVGRDAAGRPLHRFDQDRGEFGAVRANKVLYRAEIIVAADQVVKRRVDDAAMTAKIKDAAMIAA